MRPRSLQSRVDGWYPRAGVGSTYYTAITGCTCSTTAAGTPKRLTCQWCDGQPILQSWSFLQSCVVSSAMAETRRHHLGLVKARSRGKAASAFYDTSTRIYFMKQRVVGELTIMAGICSPQVLQDERRKHWAAGEG